MAFCTNINTIVENSLCKMTKEIFTKTLDFFVFIVYNIYSGQAIRLDPNTYILFQGDCPMNIKKLNKIDRRAAIKTLAENGYTDMYENDIILDVLEKRSNEVYNKSQVNGVKLFYPDAQVKKVDEHTYIFTIA